VYTVCNKNIIKADAKTANLHIFSLSLLLPPCFLRSINQPRTEKEPYQGPRGQTRVACMENFRKKKYTSPCHHEHPSPYLFSIRLLYCIDMSARRAATYVRTYVQPEYARAYVRGPSIALHITETSSCPNWCIHSLIVKAAVVVPPQWEKLFFKVSGCFQFPTLKKNKDCFFLFSQILFKCALLLRQWLLSVGFTSPYPSKLLLNDLFYHMCHGLFYQRSTYPLAVE
jgi:hypothetical protein